MTAAASDFRCATPARWLPRVLGASVLASAVWVLLDLDPRPQFAGFVKGMLIGAASLAALWVVRGGRELALSMAIERGALRYRHRRGCVEVPIAELEALDYEPLLSSSRLWPPAVVLVDRHGRRWRVPTFLENGTRLLEELLETSAADRLRAWSEARRLPQRMAHGGRWIVVGYAMAALLPAGAVLLTVR